MHEKLNGNSAENSCTARTECGKSGRPETKHVRQNPDVWLQTMFRVKDPVKSVDFYTRVLGMRWVWQHVAAQAACLHQRIHNKSISTLLSCHHALRARLYGWPHIHSSPCCHPWCEACNPCSRQGPSWSIPGSYACMIFDQWPPYIVNSKSQTRLYCLHVLAMRTALLLAGCLPSCNSPT